MGVFMKQDALQCHPFNRCLETQREKSYYGFHFNKRDITFRVQLWWIFCVWRRFGATHLRLIEKVFLIVTVKQVCNAIVGHLGCVIALQQHISGCQVPVHHLVLLQIIHTLVTKDE